MAKKEDKIVAIASVLFSFMAIMNSPRSSSPMMIPALIPHVYIVSAYMAGGDYINALIISMFWAIWMIALCTPFYLLVGKYILLSMYLPLVIVYSHNPHNSPPSSLFLFLETWLWDRPLLICVRIIGMIGSRALPPFMNVIEEKKRNKSKSRDSDNNDDFLIVGSLPLARDVANIMTKSPYNVGCVVNMCREYTGPESEYIRYGIQQFRMETPDLCEPAYEDMVDCVSFLRLFRNNIKNKKKRALIHCKGGRSRSVCIALCYLLSTGRYTTDEAFNTIKASRPIADSRVKRYKVVKRFIAELEECGSFERLQFRYVSNNLDSKGRQGFQNRVAASLRSSRHTSRPISPSQR